MADLGVCRVQPIGEQRKLAAIDAYRRTPAFSFVQQLSASNTEPLPPIDNYAVAFKLAPDPRVNQRVQQLFATESERIMASALPGETVDREQPYGDAPGYIYIFHDLADPARVLKIGRTARDPRRRMAEWERELAPDEGKSIYLLAAYPTLANEFAESVVHEVLRCHRIANRINPVTNDELEEFFTLDNLMATKLFVRESLRFIDRFCAYWRARRRRSGRQQQLRT